MPRETRCQGTVIQDGCILMVKHINHRLGSIYWWLPGGGLEPGETHEECLLREVMEETHLEVQIERLLFETIDPDKQYSYHRYVTYLCTPVSGEATAGTEGGDSPLRAITEVGWYPLWDESRWEPGFYEEHLYPLLRSIQAALRANL